MITTAKDARNHARALSISGHIKPSGMIVAKVVNDQGKQYFVTIHLDGTSTCGCKGHHEHGHCYHVDTVLHQSHTFKTYDELTQECTTTTISQPTKPTKTTPSRHMLLSLQDNRSLDEKIFGTLLPYKHEMDRLARYR